MSVLFTSKILFRVFWYNKYVLCSNTCLTGITMPTGIVFVCFYFGSHLYLLAMLLCENKFYEKGNALSKK